MPKIELKTHQSIGLQDILQVPRDGGARIRWSQLHGEPLKLALVVETLAKRLVENGHQINQKNIKKFGETSFITGVDSHYIGGITGLRQNLGITTKHNKKPPGYWTEETIEAEALKIQEEQGKLTQAVMKAQNQTSLASIISSKYPGGLNGLKRKFEIDILKRPSGEWTPESIEQEARELIGTGHSLTQKSLHKIGRADLAGAIATHYPGKLTALKRHLGVKVKAPAHEWDVNRILDEAAAFAAKYGNLNHSVLRENQRADLGNVITRIYPGGIQALKERLGVSKDRPASVLREEANTALDSLFKGEL